MMRPPPADSRVQCPAGTAPALTVTMKLFGSTHGAEQCLHAHRERREAAIESDHEHPRLRQAESRSARLDGIDLSTGERQRLLHEYVFAGRERASNELRMSIVPGRDHDDSTSGAPSSASESVDADSNPYLRAVARGADPVGRATAKSRAPPARNAGINTRPA